MMPLDCILLQVSSDPLYMNRPSSWGRCEIRQSSKMPAGERYFEAAIAHQPAAVRAVDNGANSFWVDHWLMTSLINCLQTLELIHVLLQASTGILQTKGQAKIRCSWYVKRRVAAPTWLLAKVLNDLFFIWKPGTGYKHYNWLSWLSGGVIDHKFQYIKIHTWLWGLGE